MTLSNTSPAAQQRDKGAAAKTLGGKLSYICARERTLGLQSGQRQQNGAGGEAHSGSCVATFELVGSTAGGNINPTTSRARVRPALCGCGQGLRCSPLALKWANCACVCVCSCSQPLPECEAPDHKQAQNITKYCRTFLRVIWTGPGRINTESQLSIACWRA